MDRLIMLSSGQSRFVGSFAGFYFSLLICCLHAQQRCATLVVIPNVKGNSTTTKFGDGAITRGNGQQVTTSRFGSGTISRSSDGTTTTTQRFGDGPISRSTGGASVTSSRFGSGYISRENGSVKEKEKGAVRVIPAQKPR